MTSRTLTAAHDLAKTAHGPFPGESKAYREAREKLLAEEIDFCRHMTRLAVQRQALPPDPVIGKDYRFKEDNGKDIGLRELFGAHDTLVTYFWIVVYKRLKDEVRLFWSSEMRKEMADPRQDPRDAPDIASLAPRQKLVSEAFVLTTGADVWAEMRVGMRLHSHAICP